MRIVVTSCPLSPLACLSQVGHLPPAVARKLITQQLAHTDSAGAVLQQSGSHRPPERWQSNTTSESTAVGAGSSSQAAAEETEPTHKAPQQQQQQQQQQEGSAAGQWPQQLSREMNVKLEPQLVPPVSAGVNLQQQRQADAGEQADAAIQSALAAAAAAGAQAHQAPSASAVAAAVAAASPGKPSSALTDDVIRMLVQKGLQGLHALTVAQQQQPGEQASSWQQQEPGQQQQQQQPEQELNLMDVFNTPVSTPGSASALVGALQHLPSPQQQQAYMQQLVSSTPQGSISGLLGQHYPANTLQMPSPAQQQFAGGYANQLQQPCGGGGGGGVPGSSLPPLLPLVGDGAAAGNVLSGDLGLALDGALNEAMLRGVGPWGTSTAPGLPYGTAPMAFSTAFPEQHLSLSSLQQQQQQGAMSGALDLTAAYGAAGGAYGAHNSFGAAVGGGYGPGGGYALQQQLAMQFPPGAAYTQEPDADRGAAVGPAAAAAAAGEGGGAGEKRKRAAVDPRVNCVKSVQYRVSRFPSELHDLCIEHWERARCARVVCNEVQVRHRREGGGGEPLCSMAVQAGVALVVVCGLHRRHHLRDGYMIGPSCCCLLQR